MERTITTTLDYTNITDKEAFEIWMEACPVPFKANGTHKVGKETLKSYFFFVDVVENHILKIRMRDHDTSGV